MIAAIVPMVPPDDPAFWSEARLLARWLSSAGGGGECPAWYRQFRTAQQLSIAPWRLDEQFPDAAPVPLAEWVVRAALVDEAERLMLSWALRSGQPKPERHQRHSAGAVAQRVRG